MDASNEQTKIIFNKRAADKMRSPDDLDKYIRVTSPSVWVVLASCLALLIGLLAWGVFGTLNATVSATGVCVNGTTMCFLDAEGYSEVQVGNVALVDGKRMEIESIDKVPKSRNELDKIVGSDYLVSTLATSDWSYMVSFTGDSSGLEQDVPLSVTISTKRVAPISLVFGKDWD